HKTLLIDLISELISNYTEKQESAFVNVNKSMDQSLIFLVLINVLSIIIGLIALIFISRYISNHLKRVVQATATIAKGDLTLKPLTYQGKDEIGLLAASVNTL